MYHGAAVVVGGLGPSFCESYMHDKHSCIKVLVSKRKNNGNTIVPVL